MAWNRAANKPLPESIMTHFLYIGEKFVNISAPLMQIHSQIPNIQIFHFTTTMYWQSELKYQNNDLWVKRWVWLGRKSIKTQMLHEFNLPESHEPQEMWGREVKYEVEKCDPNYGILCFTDEGSEFRFMTMISLDGYSLWLVALLSFTTLRHRRISRHFADDIFRCIFFWLKMYQFRLKFHWSLFLGF